MVENIIPLLKIGLYIAFIAFIVGSFDSILAHHIDKPWVYNVMMVCVAVIVFDVVYMLLVMFPLLKEVFHSTSF